jgi:uncharacterized protein (TIGR03435 family)
MRLALSMHKSRNAIGSFKRQSLNAPVLAALAAAILFNVAQPMQSSLHPQSQNTAANASTAKFEVASIKLNKTWAPGQRIGLSFLPGGAMSARAVNPRWLIEMAYGLPAMKGYVSGGPKWLDEDRYDFEAKFDPAAIPPGTPQSEIQEIHQQMLRALLADRFKLVLDSETKEVPVYLLTVAKGGPKLQPAAARDCSAEGARCHHISGGRSEGLSGNTSNMSDLAGVLSLFLDREVQDATGITGNFDIQIPGWADAIQSNGSAAAPDSEKTLDPNVVPDIFTVLRDHLGLKLEPQRRQVKTFIVKSIERPSEN